MRKIIATCLAVFALCFALESFGAELVSANYGYEFKLLLKLQQTPPRTPDKREEEDPKKSPTSTPKKTSGTPTRPPTNTNPTSQEQNNQTGTAQTEQNTNGQTNKKTETKDETKSESWLDNIWTLLLWLAGGIAGLAVLAGIGFLVYRFYSNTINNEREITNHGLKLANRNSQELGQRINELEKTIKLQSGQFTQIQTAIQSMQRQIKEGGGQNYQPQAIFTPPVYKPEPQFPVMAEDYLGKVSPNAQTATADLIGGLLINDSNKGNEFLIVRDNELPGNLFYAVPNQTRFQTKSDYLNYYQNYYACENPSGGAVWIKSPTTVRRVDGGWKLEAMGELEIR
jgi:hypothetical protein